MAVGERVRWIWCAVFVFLFVTTWEVIARPQLPYFLSKAFGIGLTFGRAKCWQIIKRCGSVRHPPIAQNCPSFHSHQDEIRLNRNELTGPDIEL